MKLKAIIISMFVGMLFLMPNEGHSQDYEFAAGLRLGWGVGLTGKYFIAEDAAVEGIVRYRNFGFGSFDYYWLKITGLYQVHKPLDDVLDGLQWYYGGGAFVGFWGGDFDYPGSDLNTTFFGVAGAIGLDYAFEDTPINISIDWVPQITLIGAGGLDTFSGESGLLAVRYIIK